MTLRIHKVEKLLVLGFQVAFYIISDNYLSVKEDFHFLEIFSQLSQVDKYIIQYIFKLVKKDFYFPLVKIK